MQDTLSLYKLYENSPSPSLNIVYCDGINKFVVSQHELNKRVLQISTYLDSLHVYQSTICCLIRPSLDLPAVILGILKISSAFAFLDVHRPYDTLLAFQKYLQVKVLLVEECYLKILKKELCFCWKKSGQLHLNSTFIILQSYDCKVDSCPNSKKYEKYEMQCEIAYVIQTSGTTGERKVIQVPHECIASNIIDFKSRFDVSANDVILQSTSITFDPSIVEIFLALSCGSTLIIIADHIRSVPQKLIEVIVNYNVTILQATPSLIFNFGEKLLKDILFHKDSNLRILALGGENCPSLAKLRRWKCDGNKTKLFNLYGLTEVSCWASCYEIDFQSRESLPTMPLGEPLFNTKLSIHDETGKLTDKGELYIGGFKRFCIVNDERCPESSDFMRATGDLVYKSSGGLIYFEGRKDGVVKYKGHKISFHYINTIVEGFSEVESHILQFDFASENLYLFVVWNVPGNSSESKMESIMLKKLRKVVSCLPPVTILSVPFIPVTKHGKCDREKLMNLAHTNLKRRAESINSVENCEDVVAMLWKNLTNQSNIKATDNFILVGGDSISAVQFAANIEWKYQLTLPLLVDKLLNESYEDVISFIKTCLKGCHDFISSGYKVYFSEPLPRPVIKKKRYSNSQCCKISCKQGHFKKCSQTCISKNCFAKMSHQTFNSDTLHLNLIFEWNLEKCIDATPCLLYLPQSEQFMAFIGSHSGLFSCIDINIKFEKWHVLLPGRIESSACISACGNFVLVGCYDHHVYCFNIINGNIQWKVKTDAQVKSSPSVSSNNVAFFGSHDKHIYAVDIENGYVLWKKQIAHGSIFSSPVVIEKLLAVSVATLDGVLALIKMESGDILWEYHTEKPLFSSPLIAYDYLFIGSTDNSLLCFDLQGKLKFRYPTKGPVFSSASFLKDLKEEHIVFGCHDFNVYCITSTGTLLWSILCDSAIYATPYIFNWSDCNYICVVSSKGTLYILQQNDGKLVYSWKCPGEVFSSPIVIDDMLVVGCRDNNVYFFKLINFI